jgi:hypothetical protein
VNRGVEPTSSSLSLSRRTPILSAVFPASHRRRPRRALPLAALALSAVGLAACGTPAMIKPAQNPLPGFSRDINAARNAVAQSQREAQQFGSTSVTAP